MFNGMAMTFTTKRLNFLHDNKQKKMDFKYWIFRFSFQRIFITFQRTLNLKTFKILFLNYLTIYLLYPFHQEWGINL